jgi:hypothetical protein
VCAVKMKSTPPHMCHPGDCLWNPFIHQLFSVPTSTTPYFPFFSFFSMCAGYLFVCQLPNVLHMTSRSSLTGKAKQTNNIFHAIIICIFLSFCFFYFSLFLGSFLYKQLVECKCAILLIPGIMLIRTAT